MSVEETSGVEADAAQQIVMELSRAVEARTRQSVLRTAECEGQRCANVDEVVSVRIVGGLTRTRLVAERTRSGVRMGSVEVEASSSGWAEACDRAAAQLFFDVAVATGGGELPLAPDETGARSSVPSGGRSTGGGFVTWTLIALGATAGGAAIIFAVDSANAEAALDGFTRPDEAFDREAARASRSRGIAFTLVGVAVAASIGALLLESVAR